MGLLDWLKPRGSTSTDLATLSDFVETRASFLVQKTIYEYSRARASVHSIEMFKEEAFVRAVNFATWSGLPDGLVFEALMIEGHLRERAGARRDALVEGILDVVDAIAARQPTPDVLPPDFWTGARADIETRIRQGTFAARKPVKEIPLSHLDVFFARMPIHERLRAPDLEAVGNGLKALLIGHYEEFTERFDAGGIAESLIAAGLARRLTAP